MSIGKNRCAENFQRLRHVRRKGRLERHPMSAHRVHKSECPCVEGLAGENFEESLNLGLPPRRPRPPDNLPAAVPGITKHRVMNVRQVHADLVRPTGTQLQRYQGKVTELLQDSIFGNGDFPVGHDRHLLAVGFAPPELGLDNARPFLQEPPDNCLVLPLDRAPGKLPGQVRMRRIILGNDEQSGCVFVEPVDNPGARRVVDSGERVAVVEEGIDQRACIVPAGGVNDHPRGFIHDQKMIVFKEDRERNVFGNDVRGRGFREGDMNDLTGTHLMAGSYAFPVHQDRAVPDCLLYLRPRGILDMAGQEEIEPLFFLPRRDENVEARIQVPSPEDVGVSLGVGCGAGWRVPAGAREKISRSRTPTVTVASARLNTGQRVRW